MTATIEIRKVTKQGDSKFVVGCEIRNKQAADQLFYEIDRNYHVKPTYTEQDYLIDLYHGEDLIATCVTDEKGAKEVDERYFKGKRSNQNQ